MLPAGQKSQDKCGCELDQGGGKRDQNVGSKKQGAGEAGLLNALEVTAEYLK